MSGCLQINSQTWHLCGSDGMKLFLPRERLDNCIYFQTDWSFLPSEVDAATASADQPKLRLRLIGWVPGLSDWRDLENLFLGYHEPIDGKELEDIHQWSRGQNGQSAAVNPLDRVAVLTEATDDDALLDYLCQRRGGRFVRQAELPALVRRWWAQMKTEMEGLLKPETGKLKPEGLNRPAGGFPLQTSFGRRALRLAARGAELTGSERRQARPHRQWAKGQGQPTDGGSRRMFFRRRLEVGRVKVAPEDFGEFMHGKRLDEKVDALFEPQILAGDFHAVTAGVDHF